MATEARRIKRLSYRLAMYIGLMFGVMGVRLFSLQIMEIMLLVVALIIAGLTIVEIWVKSDD